LFARFLLTLFLIGAKNYYPRTNYILPKFFAIVYLTYETPSAINLSNSGNSCLIASFVFSGHSPAFYYAFC